jgi:hypothetical protein
MASEFIEILSPKALADLEKLNAGLLETIASVDKIGQKMKTVVTPSGADSAVKQLNDAYIKQQKQLAELQIKLERYAQAQSRTKITANQLEQSEMRLANARDKQAQALTREQAKLEASANLYNKVQAKLNSLSNEYKALAVRKELGLTLTQKEEQRYASLQGRIQNYDKALKAVDASMGKYQRNVGNYASAFDPLGNSINQLTREMPAFAYSVQTGFMAISNNLPIFFDAMQQAIAQQKELQAQGKPTKNVLQLLAGSFFSLGTALSVGVTLLTIFGPKLWDSISGSKKKKEALEQEKKALEEKIEAEKNHNEQIGQAIAQEQNRARILFEIAKNSEVSFNKRKEAIDELKKRYPDYLKNLSDEEILAGRTEKAERKLNEALVQRGYALATQNLLEQNASKQMSAQVEYQKVISKGFKEINNQRTFTGAIKNEEEYAKALRNTAIANANAQEALEQKLKPLREEEEALIQLFRENAKYLYIVNENTEAKAKNAKATKEMIDPSSLKAMEGMISALEEQLSATDLTSESYGFLNNVLQAVKKSYEALVSAMDKKPLPTVDLKPKGVEESKSASDLLHESAQRVIKDLKDQIELNLKHKQLLSDLENQMKEYAFSFTQSFGQNSGFPTLFKVLNKEILGFGENWGVTFTAIGEIAQETFNFISQLSQQRFQAEYENLAQEKQIALAFAGDSASAREEIERQYEARRRQIKQREFKARQQEALFNIAIDTAQAIVGLWAKPGFPKAIPLMATVAAVGLAQSAFVASQQIPQFWRGTDNAPEGWAWTQEKGREIITDASGRVKSAGSDKGATLTYLNRGDKVYTAQESAMMFDRNLNNLLAYNGIQMPTVKVDSTLTDAQVNRIVSAVQGKESVNMNIDRNGLNVYVRNGHTTKQNINSRIRGIGRNV